MKVSVVISTYNGKDNIMQQLESIRNQERKPDEVIIIDDCSSDGTFDIVSRYIQMYSLDNWILSKNHTNQGWRVNFFNAITKSEGDLIFPCDQDDIWHLDKLKVMEKVMNDNPQINLLVSNYNAFYDNGTTKIGPNTNDNKIVKLHFPVSFFEVPNPGCTYCIRKSFASSVENYWESRFPHDAFYWRFASFTDSAYSINSDLIDWRKHTNSTFAKESVDKRSYQERIKWFNYAEQSIIVTLEYIKKYENSKNQEKVRLLKDNLKYIRMRKKFYKKKNIFLGLYLIRYKKYYMTLKRYIGDWYIIYFKR